MTPDLLDDLKLLDPVPHAPEVPDALAARVRAIPDHRRRRRVARRIVPATVLVLGIAAAVLLLGRGESESLAARAYAATSGKGIAHWQIDIAGYANGKLGSRQRTEGWALGSVTHTLHSDVRRGKAHVTTDARVSKNQYSYWSTSTYRVETIKQKLKRPKQEVIPNGDPFVNFRRAYRAGTLRDLGNGRFEVRFKHVAPGGVIYDVDPKTGQPLRLTISSDQPAMPAMHRPAMKSKTVVTFTLYEKLPVTKANRKLLALFPHPGLGTKKARDAFAALRTGSPLDEATIEQLGVGHMTLCRCAIDRAGIRKLSKDVYLAPGDGYVCLIMTGKAGRGTACRPIRAAARSGITTGTASRLLIVVPDGVKAVQGRANRHHAWRSFPITNGLARLPYFGYRWRFVR